MGLAISVGILDDLNRNDEEGAEAFRGYFDAANDLLEDNGLPVHEEPEELPPFCSRAECGSFPYSFLHYLRRAGAYVLEYPDWRARPFPDDEKPTDDPLYEKHGGPTCHLICHSDYEGLYVPIDFPEVLFDQDQALPGGMLGSTQRLQAELLAIAPTLGISTTNGELSDDEAARINRQGAADGPLSRELTVWIELFEAARLSLEHKTAICFG